LKLIIVHFHLRPGGVRTVIELATPFLLREMPSIERVILATGEARDADWNAEFRRRLAPTPIELMVEPTFRYISEQTSTPTLAGRIRRALERLLASAEPALVWAHNLSVGRNLILARELVRVCDMHERTIVMHHHDWWFDNRWRRWPEMRRLGIRTLREAARIVFPTKPCIRIATINRADASVLQRHFGKRAAWLPNLAERAPAPSAARVRAARAWLREVIGDHAPVWLLPSRLLRRKNIAEALLLTRWLRPEAALVVTGGVSSADENSYAQRLADATRRHHWRLHFGVLSSDDRRQPSVRELLAASECVLITSVQEGFGLPFVEAADSARPLIARHLPNVMPIWQSLDSAFRTRMRKCSSHRVCFPGRRSTSGNVGSFANGKRSCRASAAPGLNRLPCSRTKLRVRYHSAGLRSPHNSKYSRDLPQNPGGRAPHSMNLCALGNASLPSAACISLPGQPPRKRGSAVLPTHAASPHWLERDHKTDRRLTQQSPRRTDCSLQSFARSYPSRFPFLQTHDRTRRHFRHLRRPRRLLSLWSEPYETRDSFRCSSSRSPACGRVSLLP
jgi:hypothetical protein